ncbi:MAG: hypothetical protein ACYC3I_15210 [Gemmataceae bacterium]
MSFASWFHVQWSHRAPALKKTGVRQSCRQPIYSRPSLEYLEERTLLDASSGLFGGINNLSVNGAMGSSGTLFPIPTSGEHAASISGLDASGRSTQSVSAAFLAQDQPNSQLRVFGVNSQGDSSRLVQKTAVNMFQDAYGFGSGTQPNAPWSPAAYNLGLANHQFGYPSQIDMGFSSIPPWTTRVAQSLPEDQNPSLKRELNTDDQEAVKPEEVMVQRSLRQQEQPRQTRRNEDTSGTNEDWKTKLQQQASQKQSALDRVMVAEGKIPDSLWLTALAPVPMTALAAGLPGSAVAAKVAK